MNSYCYVTEIAYVSPPPGSLRFWSGSTLTQVSAPVGWTCTLFLLAAECVSNVPRVWIAGQCGILRLLHSEQFNFSCCLAKACSWDLFSCHQPVIVETRTSCFPAQAGMSPSCLWPTWQVCRDEVGVGVDNTVMKRWLSAPVVSTRVNEDYMACLCAWLSFLFYGEEAGSHNGTFAGLNSEICLPLLASTRS